ncbi:MAG: VTT domain-containing protein [bacterium]|nr:VTT domain-containing protein [bacterium]
MLTVSQALQGVLHVDRHLEAWVRAYDTGIYGILFCIVFCETGLVVTPFLPGDSLLFAAGALAAGGSLEIAPLLLVLFLAAVVGDSTNYWVARKFGRGGMRRWVREHHLRRTEQYFSRHGGRTLVMARFAPILRTFAPFVAGLAAMPYPRFLSYSIAGGLLWVGVAGGAGYWFGNIPIVKKHFELVILGIVAVTLLPAIIEVVRSWRAGGFVSEPETAA